MPSQIAHILVGEAALRRADSGAARLYLGGDLAPYFRLGCQGPDLFYHSQRTRPLALHYGVLAHRRAFGRFLAGLADSWLREDGDKASPWAAFVLGFATHAALDRTAHPFIVFFSGWVDPEQPDTTRYRGCHSFLERILDILLWERTRGSAVSAFDAERMLCPPGDLPPSFPEHMARGLRSAYTADTERDSHLLSRMSNAFADARRFFALTNPAETSSAAISLETYRHLDGPHGHRVVSVLYPETFPRSVDWANAGAEGWTHPCRSESEHRESFFDLCGSAEREAADLLLLILEGFRARRFSPTLQEAAGNGTLNVGNSDGKPARPRFCRPLPLPEALARELKSRREGARKLLGPETRDGRTS